MARRLRFGLPRGYGRDPFRRRLKPTAPYSTDARQLALEFGARPLPSPSPWPTRQTDLEEFIAGLGKADK